ncbi:hypothetical protein TNCV_3019341 [Trichonephila clavipes]|nr:hypothetical protein TNCV_3019341 [Trichonephila clavipes]
MKRKPKRFDVPWQPKARVPELVRSSIFSGTLKQSTQLSIFEIMEIDNSERQVIELTSSEIWKKLIYFKYTRVSFKRFAIERTLEASLGVSCKGFGCSV